MVTLDHVSLKTAAGLVLCDISLEILPGECVCVAGGSGSGKTLFLQMLMGGRRPTRGTVTVDGVNLYALPLKFLRHYRREIGVMMQENQLLPDRSIAANIALALEIRNVPKDTVAGRVSELLGQIGLRDRASALPEVLNDGEYRRVALAQAIAHRPTILLADEPIADLDPRSESIIIPLLKALHSEGSTVIIATRHPHALEALHPRMIDLTASLPLAHDRLQSSRS